MKKKTRKKKIVFTKTSIIILSIINLIMLMVLGAECESVTLFITSKIFALIVLYINTKLLVKYMPAKYQ